MLHETMQNWYRDAEIKGKALGDTQGKTEMLTHLLETKFGVLPTFERTTIERLDSEALLKCSERLLTAKTLQEVIKPA